LLCWLAMKRPSFTQTMTTISNIAPMLLCTDSFDHFVSSTSGFKVGKGFKCNEICVTVRLYTRPNNYCGSKN
jgi:hypothetical protein